MTDNNRITDFIIRYEKVFSTIRKNFLYIYLHSYQYKQTNSFKRILSWIDFERKLFYKKCGGRTLCEWKSKKRNSHNNESSFDHRKAK